MAILELKRLQDAYAKVAILVVHDPIYLPIFLRLEAEIAAAETSGDAIGRARAIAGFHRAIA